MDRIIMCLRAAWANSSMHRAALLVTVPVAFAVSAALPPRLVGQVAAPQVYTATGSDADTSAPADATAYAIPEYTSGLLGHGPVLYNGVDLFDIACLLDGDDLSCIREWGDAIINAGLCAASLFGIGKAALGARVLWKARKMKDAKKKADAKKAGKDDLLQGLLGLLLGECWDAYWAVQDLMDCIGGEETHQEDALVMFHRRLGENLNSEVVSA